MCGLLFMFPACMYMCGSWECDTSSSLKTLNYVSCNGSSQSRQSAWCDAIRRLEVCLLWELQAWRARTHRDTHTFSVFCSLHLLCYSQSQIKVKVLVGWEWSQADTTPLSTAPGSKEVESWRGQAAWPGKSLKEQRGGSVQIDRG